MHLRECFKWKNLRTTMRNLFFVSLLLTAPAAYSASKTILVLGDSLSAEYGLARGSGWVNLLQNRLKTERIEASIFNASISGETTSGGLTRLPALLKKHQPDIVIIELGANDGLRGFPLKTIDANLHSMIALSKKTHAKVLLIGMRLPTNYGQEYGDKFHAVFANVANNEKVPLVPFFLEGVADHNELFQADRIHPAAAAHPIMLNNVWPMLKPLLPKSR